MNTKVHYTEEDNKVIREEVKKSPTNLTVAFKAASKKLNNRTWQSIAKHYYHSMQKEKSDKLFLTISSKKQSNNYKVTRKGPKATKYQPEQTKKSKWKRILAILAE